MALPSRSTLPLALAALVTSSLPAAADVELGQRLFRVQCAACHAVVPGRNMVGPTLAGIVGRPSGTVEGFRYSSANKTVGLTWTPELLDKYVANPREVVPGTTMSYAGMRNEAQRASLIAYLETLR